MEHLDENNKEHDIIDNCLKIEEVSVAGESIEPSVVENHGSDDCKDQDKEEDNTRLNVFNCSPVAADKCECNHL